MTGDIAVLAEDWTKFDCSRRGIEGLNLDVRGGEVMGFLRPNGAGKTTTIRLMLDFLHPTRTPPYWASIPAGTRPRCIAR